VAKQKRQAGAARRAAAGGTG